MLLFQDPPTVTIQPVEESQAILTVATSDRPIAIRVNGALEQDVVRYQLIVFRSVSLRASTPAPGASDPAPLICSWKVTSALQWQICGYSHSGVFMCSDASAHPLPDGASGSVSLAPGPQVMGACGYALPPLHDAVEDLQTRLRGEADELINASVHLLSDDLGKKGPHR